MNLAYAAAVGAVSGLRSMSGPAVVSQAAARNLLPLSGTPLAWLQSGSTANALGIMAIGELIADKLPFIPNRTDPPSLVFRAVSGAFCAYAICRKRWPGRGAGVGAWIGASIGAAAAIATSYAGFEYRKRAPIPPVWAALLEDAVTLSAGTAILSGIGRGNA